MGSLSYVYSALTALALAAAPSLRSPGPLAQERSFEAYERIPVITITPTRRETPVERVGSTITVVTAEETERRQRSEERGGGKGCVSTCEATWSPFNKKK